MRFIMVLGLVILVMGCGSDSVPSKPRDRNSDQPRPSKPQPFTPKEEDGIGVDVWAKYKENATQAEAKYKYKRTEVMGTIVSVTKGQEFPPSWAIFLKRTGEPGDYQYVITANGHIGEEIVKHAKVGHEMTVQGSVDHWHSSGMLFIGADKLIRVK